MPDYQLFGGIFRSEVELPELRPSPSPHPRWWLSRAASPLDAGELLALGSEDVEPGIRATFYSSGAGYRLVFDDTGIFDISRDGRRVRWTAPENIDIDAVRKDVLGRVAAVCLDLDGMTVLHGSAVQIGDQSVVFLAPKFHGKSTTAAALVDRGARLLADDLVAVTRDRTPRILPGIPVVQLWQDSAARVAQHTGAERGDGRSLKLQRGWDDTGRAVIAPPQFAAAYLLAPFVDEPTRPVHRERLVPVAAALALLGQAKVGNLLGVERRSRMLTRLTEIASVVPVYRLELPRDFSRLAELTDTLWAWHTVDA